MKTTTVSRNSYQLTRLGLFNCYLVREPDGFTLVDTGLAGSAKDILAAAAALGAPVRRILLTHAHRDHVGSVDALLAELNSSGNAAVELAASVRSLPLLRQPPDKATLSGEPASKVKGALPGIASAVTRTLAEDDLYGSLHVLETPGHIPGHLSFLDERDGTLFAGDALVGVGKLVVSGYAPWYFPLPNFATWDRDLALASVRRLLDLPSGYHVERFACGHGAVRPRGLTALRAAIARAG